MILAPLFLVWALIEKLSSKKTLRENANVASCEMDDGRDDSKPSKKMVRFRETVKVAYYEINEGNRLRPLRDTRRRKRDRTAPGRLKKTLQYESFIDSFRSCIIPFSYWH